MDNDFVSTRRFPRSWEEFMQTKCVRMTKFESLFFVFAAIVKINRVSQGLLQDLHTRCWQTQMLRSRRSAFTWDGVKTRCKTTCTSSARCTCICRGVHRASSSCILSQMMTLVASCERHVYSATIDANASIASTNAHQEICGQG